MMVNKMKADNEEKEQSDFIAKQNDWNLDMSHPDHNQGKKFTIEYNVQLGMTGEPPQKDTDNPDKPTIQEEEGKGAELDGAKKESANFEAKKAADAKAAEENAALQAKLAADAAAMRPDGTMWKPEGRLFPDGSPVKGVNNYNQRF